MSSTPTREDQVPAMTGISDDMMKARSEIGFSVLVDVRQDPYPLYQDR